MAKNPISVMYESNIPKEVAPLAFRGKVRDTYDISDLTGLPDFLIITTDRLSVFDVPFSEPIPYKGYVLNQLSLFWFDYLERYSRGSFTNHLITADINRYPKELQKYCEQLEGRSMIVKKYDIIPLECIVRGYLTGSAKEDYDKTGKVGWHELPEGLAEASKLPKPIFTPSTKAEQGKHDENIRNRDDAMNVLNIFFGSKGMDCGDYHMSNILYWIETICLNIYHWSSQYAESRGIIIADTKLELACTDTHNKLFTLCDEVLTPDSSRFWPLEGYEPGKPQPSYDKQFVRDYLKSVGFTGKGEPPSLPQDIIEKTTEKYIKAHEILTGQKLNI